jgi:hypothetical protein
MNRNSFKAYCNASKRYASGRPKAKPSRSEFYSNPDPPVRPLDQPRACTRDPKAPPTYPFLAYATVKDRSEITQRPANAGPKIDLL